MNGKRLQKLDWIINECLQALHTVYLAISSKARGMRLKLQSMHTTAWHGAVSDKLREIMLACRQPIFRPC